MPSTSPQLVETDQPSVNLSSNTKSAMIDLLNARLAEGLDLALITKQAHWNLKGPTFIAVHEFLDELRDDLDEQNDIVAERVAQLDGIALGTSQAIVQDTTLAPYPTDIRRIEDHLRNLVDRYAQSANNARKGIDTADDAGDADTADILTAYSRVLDKSLWFLKSHLE